MVAIDTYRGYTANESEIDIVISKVALVTTGFDCKHTYTYYLQSRYTISILKYTFIETRRRYDDTNL